MTHHHLSIGDPAPQFTLINQFEKKVTPMALEGKRTLLSFHPLAWTSVCEIQMRSLDVKHAEFEKLGVIPYGISVDSVPCKKAWAESLGISKTNMLSDFWPHGEIAEKFGVFNTEEGISARVNILIGVDHRIEWIREYELIQIPDIEEILEVISSKNHE